jgi:hypothetical protein
MSLSIYDTYARKICIFFDIPPGSYSAAHLSGAVLQLPFAEAHMELDGVTVPNLPKLGAGLTLQAHMQKVFFDTVKQDDVPLFLQTAPFLIRAEDLSALEYWREWKTLGIYLRQLDLEPVLVFRNQPHKLPVSYTEDAQWYVADLRVLLVGEGEFEWGGQGSRFSRPV